MNVTMDLLHIVEQAHSLARILDEAARVIVERLRVDGCLVFLLDEHGDLVRSAADSSNSSGRSQRADAEAESIAVQVTAERRVATIRGETTSLLASPMLLRDSIVGALVLQSTVRRDFSAEDIGTLATICAQLVGIIENARIIDALDRGERPVPQPAPGPLSTESKDGEQILREDSRMASMSDPYHPAILRMIARVASAARAAGKAVSVCGEIAVRPDVALALMALGVNSLSVVPTAIPGLKQALAAARLEPMRRAMEGILALSDARSVAAALREAQLA